MVEVRSWRDERTLSKQQRMALDFITQQGYFSHPDRRTRQPFCLYGGAGFGGKSYLLRSAMVELALRLVGSGVKEPWGALFCDTYPNLTDRHLGKLSEEMGHLGKVQATKLRGLHFAFHDKALGGCYLRNVQSEAGGGRGRPGSEFDYLLVDELTEFTRSQWDSIMYTGRSSKKLPYFAFLGASNPDGIGHMWVKELFHPGYVNRRDQLFTVGRVAFERDMLFVPALKSDNPAYKEMADIIDARFALITDPDVQRARNEGSWDLYASGRFGTVWNRKVHVFKWDWFLDYHGIPEMDLSEFLRRAPELGFSLQTALDYATSVDAVSAYGIEAISSKGQIFTLKEMGMSGLQLEDQAERIHQFEAGLEIETRLADPAIAGRAAERDDNKTRQERFMDCGINFELAINDRVEGWASIGSLMHYRKAEDGTAATLPRWMIHEDCIETIRELPSLPRSRTNPEDVDPMNGIWHWSDRLRYSLHWRHTLGALPQRPVKKYSGAWFREHRESQRRKQPGRIATFRR